MKIIFTVLLSVLFLNAYAQEQNIIKEFTAKIRVNHNYRLYEISNVKHGDYASALMTGGELSILTNTYYSLSARATLASSDYVVNNPNHKDAVYNFLFGEENIAVRSESFLSYTRGEFKIESGRKKINSPFANASDAFIIPITYEGVFSRYKVNNLNLQLMNINEIKARNTSSFVNVADFALTRLNQTTSKTKYNNETQVIGINYKTTALKVNLWNYNYSDLFTTSYFDTDYSYNRFNYALQLGQQDDSGESLIGDVNSNLLGIKFGYKTSKGVKFSFGHNKVETNENSFLGGAWLTPYTFFTDSLYTNSMLSGMGNVAPGNATKVMLRYNLTEKTSLRLSYSQLTFAKHDSVEEIEQEEIDFWITSNLPVVGLTATNRFARLDSAIDGQSVFAWRSQLQYTF
jgi:hypothetical protein